MRSKSRRGYKAAHCSLFIATPQSRLAPCQLPVRGAFWCGANSNQKLSPQAGKVDTNGVSGRKGNDSKLSSYFTVPPQSRLRLDSSPASGGAFWCLTNSRVKPALKGEVDANEMSRRRGCSCLSQPLSQSASRRIASSPDGEPLARFTNSRIKQTTGTASRPHSFTSSPAHPPSGGFHIAKAIFHCASAQFHPASAGFHRA